MAKQKEKLKAACIKHVDFEGLGHVENWLKRHNIDCDMFEVYKELLFPDPKHMIFYLLWADL